MPLADELGLSVLLMRPLGEGRLTENAAGGVAASAGTGTWIVEHSPRLTVQVLTLADGT